MRPKTLRELAERALGAMKEGFVIAEASPELYAREIGVLVQGILEYEAALAADDAREKSLESQLEDIRARSESWKGLAKRKRAELAAVKGERDADREKIVSLVRDMGLVMDAWRSVCKKLFGPRVENLDEVMDAAYQSTWNDREFLEKYK
jgi:hypothetical protein